ncbi:MAG: hypothetical protein HYR85_27270 [Planctomycetes bacterium]|nr:hypothetical protein [Planctomycetota bacterium]MBI3848355.1 hypothetical protein [Planctomycetota bacterium]
MTLKSWAPVLVSVVCIGAIVAFKRSERAATASSAAPSALAWVGDQPITAADVDRRLALLRSTEFASRSRADGRDSTPPKNDAASVLEYLIEEELIFREASERRLDKDEFVRRHVTNRLMEEEVLGRAQARGEDESALRVYFSAHAAEFGGKTFDEVREPVRAKFVEAETARLTREMIDTLRTKWGVHYETPPPSSTERQP